MTVSTPPTLIHYPLNSVKLRPFRNFNTLNSIIYVFRTLSFPSTKNESLAVNGIKIRKFCKKSEEFAALFFKKQNNFFIFHIIAGFIFQIKIQKKEIVCL